jgi:hypothetical protein
MKRAAVAVGVVGLVLAGCGTTSSSTEDAKSQSASAAPVDTSTLAPTTAKEPARPVIAVIQTRDRKIAIHGGGRVTVRSTEGVLLAEDVPVESLRDTDPYVYDVVRSSYAGAGANHPIDARLDPKTRTQEKRDSYVEGALGN